MHITLLLGSAGQNSKSSTLARHLSAGLEQQGVTSHVYGLDQFAPHDLLSANFKASSIQTYIRSVRESAGLIIATPVYKASISGLLKTLLDLIPESGLEKKSVLGVASGGTNAHMLAVDHALQPILINLKAGQVLPTVFACENTFGKNDDGSYRIANDIVDRLDSALGRFIDTLSAHPEHPALKERAHQWLRNKLAT